MRELVLCLVSGGLVACASTSATGRLPARLVDATGGAVPGRPVVLRSTDGVHFAETEVSVEMDSVPSAVRALRGSGCPNRDGSVRYSRLEVDGADAYAVYVGEGPRFCAVTARRSGMVVRVDEAIDPASLPAAAARTVEGIFHDDYTVTDAFKRTAGGSATLEVHVRKSGQEYVLVLAPSGTLQLRMRRYPAILDVPDR
ncbi:MAG: hypothetical protein HYY06_29630 [Deltaproteobacteria bacterium]|nr:hypothetical protein [Deltaproteobacteria bacterium]